MFVNEAHEMSVVTNFSVRNKINKNIFSDCEIIFFNKDKNIKICISGVW